MLKAFILCVKFKPVLLSDSVIVAHATFFSLLKLPNYGLLFIVP